MLRNVQDIIYVRGSLLFHQRQLKEQENARLLSGVHRRSCQVISECVVIRRNTVERVVISDDRDFRPIRQRCPAQPEPTAGQETDAVTTVGQTLGYGGHRQDVALSWQRNEENSVRADVRKQRRTNQRYENYANGDVHPATSGFAHRPTLDSSECWGTCTIEIMNACIHREDNKENSKMTTKQFKNRQKPLYTGQTAIGKRIITTESIRPVRIIFSKQFSKFICKEKHPDVT